MATAISTLTMAMAMALTAAHGPFSTHAHYAAKGHHPGSGITPPGPGYGWGFPNGAPDGYGWYDVGTTVPIGADRTPTYYFPRHFAVPMSVMVFPNYYNDYTTRGQRYIPYTGCGGLHPAGRPTYAPSTTPIHPYDELADSPTVAPVPTFRGEVSAEPVNPGSTDLIP